MLEQCGTQQIRTPLFRDLKWILGLARVVWFPVGLAIVVQLFGSVAGAYSLDALRTALSALEGPDLPEPASWVVRPFVPDGSSVAAIAAISCVIAIALTVLVAIGDIVVAWTISLSVALLNKNFTPRVITSLVEALHVEGIATQESTVVQRWLLLRTVADFFHNVFANSIGSVFDLSVLLYFTYAQNRIAGHCLLGILAVWVLLFALVSPVVVQKAKRCAIGEERLGREIRNAAALSDMLKPQSILERFLLRSAPKIAGYSTATRAEGLWGSVLYGTLSGTASLAPLFVVLVAVSYPGADDMNLATAGAIYLFAARMSSPLNSLAHSVPVFQRQRVDFVRLKSLIELDSVGKRVSAGDSALVAKSITPSGEPRRYDSVGYTGLVARYGRGVKLAFADVSVAKGRVSCVVGASGTGKSTLLKLISGRLPFDGMILMNGAVVVDAEALRNDVAYLPQEPKLAEMTVRENVELFTGAGDISGGPWAHTYQRLVNALIHGEQSVVSSDVIGLSVGQRRAIVLLCCLSSDKPILVLDEPLSSFDDALRDELWRSICIVAQEKVVIVSLHENHLIDECGTRIQLS